MKIAPLPEDESKRLETLRRYKVLDTIPEQDFDDITKIASQICKTPIALISLVDESRQWFKSKVGIDAPETPRDVAFCAHAILQEDVFIVPDSFEDERFHDNPLAVGGPNVRFYAGAPLITPKGYKIGTLCVIDSSPRNLNPEAKEALAALARQVVSQLELRIAKEIAETGLKAKARFLANMSHEIRTPMNAVLSCTNLLLDNVKQPENVKLLKTVQSSGETLLTLINDILDFSKIESGKMEIESVAFDIQENTFDIVELLKEKASEKKCELSCDIDESVPRWILGDVIRLRQVLVNLIGNAIKFTKTKVEVRVQSKVLESGRHKIQISVIDDGVGLAKEDQKKLFQDFSQVDASTTRRFGGTGLGLAICKGIAQSMGGKIWVESEPNQGATFSFTMVVEETNAVERKKKNYFAEISPQMAVEHPLKVLLAEDNTVNQMVAKKVIAKLGYRVDVVANGLEAVDSVMKNEYDIVLMDQHMPEMDGLKATAEIRKNRKDRPKIYALTASAFKEDKDRCLAAGMDGFLTKPMNIEELIDAFQSCEANSELLLETRMSKVINVDALYSQFEGAEDILVEIAEQCLDLIPKYASQIEQAIENENSKALEMAAHTLKGALSNLEAKPVVDAAMTLEVMGRKKSFDTAEEAFGILKAKIEQLEPHIKHIATREVA